MARIVSLIALLAVIIVCGLVFYQVMAGFILPLFLAALLVVIFRPLHVRVLEACRGRHKTAAALSTLAVLVIVLVPLGWLFTLAVMQGVDLVQHFEPALMQKKVARVRERLGLEMPYATPLKTINVELNDLIDEAESDPPDTVGEQRRHLQRIEVIQGEIALIKTNLKKAIGMGDGLLSADGITVKQAEAALGLLPRLEGSLERITQEKLYEGDADYVPTLQESQLAYMQFRQTLLGGPGWAWARDMANPTDDEIRTSRHWAMAELQAWLISITGTTASKLGEFLLGMAIMVVAFYFFLADGPAMLKTLMRLSPLDDEYEVQLITEFTRTTRAVVLATLLTALAQAILAALGFWVAGVGSLFLLTLLTAVLAMVPFVGAAAVWVPVCLWLYFIEERTLASVLLFCYGVGIISLADNIIKPLILHGQSQMHPLLALLSVLGGVQALGPIGIVVGPMMVAFLQALLTMLNKELGRIQPNEMGSMLLAPVTEVGGTTIVPAKTTDPKQEATGPDASRLPDS